MALWPGPVFWLDSFTPRLENKVMSCLCGGVFSTLDRAGHRGAGWLDASG